MFKGDFYMKKYNTIFLILILSTIFIKMGCENNYPDSIWNPSYSSKPTPVINDISPDSSYSGIGVVTINGQNFSSNISENRVFFNGAPAKILSASETQLEVQVPTLVEDSILLQVDVKGAYLLGEYGGKGSADVPFKLIDAIVKYLAVDATKEISGLACDLNDNVYTNYRADRSIVQLSSTDSTSLPEYGPSGTVTCYGMKWGPGGYLYFVRKNTRIYRVLPGGGSNETFVSGLDERVLDLDFDQNGNIFTAGLDGKIFSVSPSADVTTVATYDEYYDINCLRVYDGYLYSAMKYDLIAGGDSTVVQRGIWRNQILDASGNLGPNEFMFDWDSYAGEFGPDITSMVIDENGMFYLGNNYNDGIVSDADQAIIKLDIFSGFTEPLYPEILEAGVNNLCWGNTNFLYIHHYKRVVVDPADPTLDEITRELIRLAMPLNSAPYYGRQ
jgi:hypothetical protein